MDGECSTHKAVEEHTALRNCSYKTQRGETLT